MSILNTIKSLFTFSNTNTKVVVACASTTREEGNPVPRYLQPTAYDDMLAAAKPMTLEEKEHYANIDALEDGIRLMRMLEEDRG